MTKAIKQRLQKIEDLQKQQQEVTVPNDAEELLWSVARNGSDAAKVQAIKAINELKFASSQQRTDTRTEAQIRESIECLIAEYRQL